MILKIAAVWPYLLRDRNGFGRTHLDIERNSYARFRRNSSGGFGGDHIYDNGENQSWPAAAIFVDGQEQFSGMHN